MKTEKLWRFASAIVLVCSFGALAAGDTLTNKAKQAAREAQGELQLKTARANPLQLRQFLKKMPKGADLHYHLGGGVYAESLIEFAADDGLCVDLAKWSVGECPANGETKEIVSAKKALEKQSIYDSLVDSFSMRSFLPSAGVSAHDHFFDSFGKVGVHGHKPEMVDEAASRAAAQNEQYMELMVSPPDATAQKIADKISGEEKWGQANYKNGQFGEKDFADLREEFRGMEVQSDAYAKDAKEKEEECRRPSLKENVECTVAFYQSIETGRAKLEHCDDQASSAKACSVDVRYICQISRGKAFLKVFAQTLLCFEASSAAPETLVGLNLVMPEDGIVSMRDYDLHMRMLRYLHGAYPKVHITLHAGELAYGLVPPEGLCCHVRGAVEVAGAERIGHGVDVMYEDRPHELLKEMAAKHVMVEINLTSNDVILGISGKNHPFAVYQQLRVPMALSTDDEGVSRIDLTNEYVRAVETYDLKYVQLKNMARTGLEHAFLPGESLWAKPDVFTASVKSCEKDQLGGEKPTRACDDFLHANPRSKQQWELERRFRAFEQDF
jgi:adenosine deaminase